MSLWRHIWALSIMCARRDRQRQPQVNLRLRGVGILLILR